MSEMAFTLVNPEAEERGEPQIYMSVLYLATALDREGYKVNVIDAQIDDAKKELGSVVKKSDCVGFSVMTTQIKNAVELSDYVKSIDPDIPVIWGGIHPTLFPVQTIMDKSVDFVMREEGEIGMLELMQHIRGERKVQDVSGLVYIKSKGGKGAGRRHPGSGDVRTNPLKPYMNLNGLSPPSWHLIKMKMYATDYVFGGENFGRYLPVHSGRGCPHRCTFCINTIFKWKKWRPLSPDNMINEIRILKERFGLRFIKFVDENFFIDRKRVMDFCSLMLKEKLDVGWRAGGRANYFNDRHVNDELLGLAKKAGCKIISMGIESGSDRVLREVIRKGITVEDALNSVRKCKMFDIMPVCSFMMGLPGERKEERLDTLSLIRKMKNLNRMTVIIGPQIFRPYPGCELYDKIRNEIEEPKTLRGWAGIDTFSGYVSPKYLPWIEDPQHLINMFFYITLSESSTKGFARVLKLPFKVLSDLRNKHNMFDFPIEKEIYESGKSVYYSLRNMIAKKAV